MLNEAVRRKKGTPTSMDYTCPYVFLLIVQLLILVMMFITSYAPPCLNVVGVWRPGSSQLIAPDLKQKEAL